MKSATRRILLGVVIIVIAAAASIWIVRGPGPIAFAEGAKVALADYTGGDPTGVSASLSSTVPFGLRLQEGVSGVERLALAIDEFERQVALKNVESLLTVDPTATLIIRRRFPVAR